MWGAIIGGVASVAGSLFGGRKQKPQSQTTTSHVDYKRMVREAEAAGFNPLTALRNGGAAGFSVSTGTISGGGNAPLSLGNVLGGVANGVNTFLANFDPHRDTMREQESNLIAAQISNLNASTAAYRRVPTLGGVPSVSGSRLRIGGGELNGRPVTTGPLPSPVVRQTPEVVTPQVVNPGPTWWERSPNSVNVEDWESAYGEFAGSAIGSAIEISKDVRHNIDRAVNKAWPDGMPIVGPVLSPKKPDPSMWGWGNSGASSGGW